MRKLPPTPPSLASSLPGEMRKLPPTPPSLAPSLRRRFAGRFNPFATNIPMKWPMKAALNETTSQAQQRCVNPSHVANGRDPPSIAGNPPASCLVRHIGGPTWHGDSLYPQLYPVAARSFPAVWNWPDGQQAGSVPRHGPLIKRPLTAAIPTV